MSTHRNPEQTRRLLLETAYDEIRKRGFRATNIEEILDKTALAKGTLYHYFATKNALGYAVVDEVLMPEIAEQWITPLKGATHPLAALCQLVECAAASEIDIQYGCALTTMSQELSPQDEEFRSRLNRIYDQWRGGIAEALRVAQDQGEIRSAVDVDSSAAFIVSAIEGALSIAKASQSLATLQSAAKGLLAYLSALRP